MLFKQQTSQNDFSLKDGVVIYGGQTPVVVEIMIFFRYGNCDNYIAKEIILY